MGQIAGNFDGTFSVLSHNKGIYSFITPCFEILNLMQR